MALKIEYLNRASLLRYERNARTHSNAQIEQIANSIREFGFTQPVLIDENNELIAGHGRLSAAESLELDPIPAIRLKGLSEAQKKALRVADNKLPLNAGWDMQLLAEEIRDISDSDFDIEVLGFSEDELGELEQLLDEPDGEPEPDPEPVVKIKYLAIDKDRVPATDEEIAQLLDVYQQYHDAHGTHEGFVRYLAEGRQ